MAAATGADGTRRRSPQREIPTGLSKPARRLHILGKEAANCAAGVLLAFVPKGATVTLSRPLRLISFALSLSISLLYGRTAAQERTNFPPEARQRYEQALELQKKGQLKEAINAYEEAIKLGMKDYPRAHLYKAGSFLNLKQYDTAIAQYTKFLERFSLEDSCRY
jgi:tetratricopeptide (TPR) repeat protein